jgi:Flp pilus assembly protein TadG
MMRTPLHRRTSARDERGAVMVLVAVTLPVILLFVAFGVEVGHWFDYSRNLQNRADAAALAAAVAYGNTCFTTPTGAQTDVVGKVAQQYAGPPAGTPAANLPFPSINGTYKNQPNLTKGDPANFHMLLNSTQYWPSGSNWSMGTAGHTNSTALCSSQDEDGNVGAMVDVRLTQANLGLFFPLFGFRPTISAHARAALQGESGSAAAPIAVGDSGSTPCASIKLFDAANNLLQTIQLTKEPPNPQNPSGPTQFDNTSSPASFTMPNSSNVYAQAYLSDCNGNGQTYDDSTNTGLLMINNHPSTAPTVANDNPPQLSTGGVTVSGACPNATQYFAQSGAACTVEVDATVAFAPNVGNNGNLVLVQHSWDNVNQVWTTTQNNMHPSGNGANACANPAAYCTNVTIADTSGIDQFSLNWEQEAGSIGGTACGDGKGQRPPPCTGQIKNGDILQQVFGACNGCDQPDDSGPIIFARISEVNGGVISNDTNSFAGGSMHNVVFTLKLSGVNTAAPGDPPIVLRFANSQNHQTGLVDCGQGNGANADESAIFYGCGPGNPQFNPPLNPLFINTRNTCGTPPGPPWPNTNQQDCVKTTPGSRRVKIVCTLVDRIVGAGFGTTCQGGNGGTCPANNWSQTTGSANIPAGDPRAVVMIITADVDLAAGVGSPQYWIPIRRFATFYVTGWDQNIHPSCTNVNEPYPIKGKRNSQNGALWGHWINYVDTAGTPNGQLCVVSAGSPTNCVPALTR